MNNRVAVVTGSTQGIGFAIAKRLAHEGVKVVICSRKQANVDKAVKDLQKEGLINVTGIVCHVALPDNRKALIEHAIKMYGGIDILIANAGMNPHVGPVLETSSEAWDKIMDVNLKSVFQLTQEIVPYMTKRGGGSIVYVSSIVAYLPIPIVGTYAIAKTGLLALTKVISIELGPQNIRVNCVAPGVIQTKMIDEILKNPGVQHIFANHITLQRLGFPDEIAGMVNFLCSKDASYITGETFTVAGGLPSRL